MVLARAGRPAAQGAPVSAGPADPKLIDDLVAANRILVEQGILDGYGHVSVRHDRDASRYLMSRSIAPELVTAADVLEYDLDNVPVDPRGRVSYLERFIHGEIYKARPDIRAVVHSHSPSVIPFGVTGIPLRPLYHMSAFLAGGAPVFDIRAASGAMTDMLVKTPGAGRGARQDAGERAGGAHARPRRGGRGRGAAPGRVPERLHGVNAKLQAQAMALGGPVTYLDPDEARQAEASIAGTLGRPWELWRRKALSR
jgi:HCOMODA/2-hydroxy-3-carboxy-muconic semialdehyde decarboxylase